MISLSAYTLNSVLHETENSIVFRGTRAQDGLPIIGKMIRDEYPTTAQLARFQGEFELLRNLAGDGVVEAFAIEQFENRKVILLEDFGGRSLHQLYHHEPCPVVDGLRLAIRISRILSRIHQANVIHKDITPGNIVFNPAKDIIKLIDFGSATHFALEKSEFQSVNVLEGTLAYISPEQTGRMNRGLDYRTDLYSLGVVLYELFTGQLPFQSRDLLELVHCHLAVDPIPPHQVNPGIPEIVSDIILKLMAKAAEDRYQSAEGVTFDLHETLNQLEHTGRVSSFVLGRHEVLNRFQIPQKLYGRETETAELLSLFRRVSDGTSELGLISGYSGIGKSALVQELFKPITEERGYFISGKFNQFQRNVPYASVIQAFQSLIRQILTESESQIAQWRQELTEALGINGELITAVIPEVELIIGPQPPVVSLGPTETRNRFNLVFQNFIRVFAQADHPLVLFLDDLQWADPDSLKLIGTLISANDIQHLLVLGAYRDNEVDPGHPLMMMLHEAQKNSAQITDIKLTPLGVQQVTALVADTLNQSPETVAPLAELVFGKAAGNPFFTSEFLKHLNQDRLIWFDPEPAEWVWEIDQIRTAQITDNVVELITDNIQRLGPATVEVLTMAACLGNQFDLLKLSLVTNKTERKIISDLREAVREGLILPLGDGYQVIEYGILADRTSETIECKFAHDRIQQAVYSLIPSASLEKIHFTVGHRLLNGVASDQVEDLLFEIVNHLNAGRRLLSTDHERLDLAQLNHRAGCRARESAAFQPALNYFSTAVELLPADVWSAQYQFTLKLYEDACEAAFLCGQYEQMQTLAAEVMTNASNVIDTLKIYDVRSQALFAQNQLKDSVDIALEFLKKLEIEFPLQPTQDDIGRALHELNRLLNGRPIESLVDLPVMTDPLALAAQQMLARIGVAAYAAYPQTFPLIVAHRVKLSLLHGNTPLAVSAYASYGLFLSGWLQNIDAGYEFSKLALELIEKFGAEHLRIRVSLIHYAMVSYWKDHLKDCMAPLIEIYKSGLEQGDFEYATSLLLMIALCEINLGTELNLQYQNLVKYGDLLKRMKQTRPGVAISILKQVVSNLLGQGTEPIVLIGDDCNATHLLANPAIQKDTALLGVIHLYQLELCIYFQRYAEALVQADLTRRYLPGLNSTGSIPMYHFYDALARLAIAKTDGEQRAALLAQVEATQLKLGLWARKCPGNVAHKFHLVEAERLGLEGKIPEAMAAYDTALELAKRNGYIQEEALANELAAGFYASLGRTKIARMYLEEARYGYARWGATAVLQRLEANHPELLSRPAEIRGPATGKFKSPTVTTSTRTDSTSTGAIDMNTVIRASQVISSEIVLDRLLVKIMRLVIGNAGAQRAALLLPKDGQFFIEAQCDGDLDHIQVLQSQPVTASTSLPQTVINFVARTLELVLSDNVSEDRRFARDPYIEREHPASMLCLPVQNQGKLTAILYLENKSVPGAFTSQRVELMNLLTAQSAMSIENALLYASLESKVKVRTAELTITVEQLQRSEAEIKEKNTQILDSIRYAERIQQAILSADEPVVQSLGEYFILFRPRDIVSGDFYWFQEVDGALLLAVADCTGHGVPGALMSMIGTSLLNQIVIEKQIHTPGLILQHLHVGIRRALRQDEGEASSQDGMDIGIIRIEADRQRVTFAGAKRPLYLADSTGNFQEIQGDRKPIGGRQKEAVRHFTEHQVEIQDEMTFYLCTDGLADQPGDIESKFGTRRVRELLQANCQLSLDEQHTRIIAAIAAHQGQTPQRDDMALVGVRIRI